MDVLFEKSLHELTSFIEDEQFKGWDPYDGLNSKLFQSIPIIRDSRLFRLAWIQFFKKSPINFRKIVGVEKGYNSKGLALFVAGYCKLYSMNNDPNVLQKINFLCEKILSIQSKEWSGSCWGYNFDWQARAFFQPKNTPTVVASVYVSSALLDAYEITNNKRYLDAAISCCDFILKDLNRTYDNDGDFCFSYSPLDKTIVYNASLLGSRLLSRVYSITGNELLKTEAEKSVKFCIKHQQSNGAWAYGQQSFHYWVDNFHTGFNLECIASYRRFTNDSTVDEAIEKGFKYYVETFFDEKGRSKYYNNQLYPIDIHSPTQLMVTLSALNKFNEYKTLADKVLLWTINNMQDKKGFFYYQINKYISSKIPYMRWSQAWIFYAFCVYKQELNENRVV